MALKFLVSILVVLGLTSSLVQADEGKLATCPAGATAQDCLGLNTEEKERGAVKECEIHEDADFSGEDLDAAENTPSAEQCSKVCAQTAGCKAWTFRKTGPAANTCYLKHSPLGADSDRLRKSDCCDSGTPCATPKFKPDPLRSPRVQQQFERQAAKILEALFLRSRFFFTLPNLAGLVGAAFLLLLGLQLLGSGVFSKFFAPMKPGVADGEEKESAPVLISEQEYQAAALATRKATLVLPLAYAPVLENTQWHGVSGVKYSYKQQEDARLVEVCSDVVDRSREEPDTFTLETKEGFMIRIEGEKTSVSLGKGVAPVPLESGSLICPLIHLEDRQRLAMAFAEHRAKARA